MSLLNVWVSDHRALVAVDTQGINPDGSCCHGSKIYHLAHSNLIIAGRGLTVFSRLVFDICHHLNASYDEAIEQLPMILSRASELMYTQAETDGVAGMVDLVQQEVVLVGWSERSNGLQAAWRKRSEFAGGFLDQPIAPALIAPHEPAWGYPPYDDLSSAAHMERMARWQVDRFRRMHPGESDALGGRLLIAELLRDSMSMKVQCDLDDGINLGVT